ncbi:hypothetical protein VKT23_015234 [Stygiomarasmius scandens]|uniref:Uncharacterized protein n=1 Tax=Marasmiellus scandens TaxID=2682957 RepID=A0ABR1IYI3_9AGAR
MSSLHLSFPAKIRDIGKKITRTDGDLQGTDKGFWIVLDIDNGNKLPFIEAAEQIDKFSLELPGENLFHTKYGPKPNIAISCSDVTVISTADNVTPAPADPLFSKVYSFYDHPNQNHKAVVQGATVNCEVASCTNIVNNIPICFLVAIKIEVTSVGEAFYLKGNTSIWEWSQDWV